METNSQNIIGFVASRIWWLVLLRGILALLLGILLFTNTAATLTVIMMFLGAYWLVDGMFIITASIHGRKQNASWGWGIFVGILSILAGLVILLHPMLSAVFTTTFLAYFVGFMILISGISSIVTGFQLRKTSGEWMMILGGILAVLLGVLLLFNPILSAMMLVFMLGAFSIVGGIVLIILSFRIRKLKNVFV
jgi:uncharacterized membrane protein HdeD (DUF308 family)